MTAEDQAILSNPAADAPLEMKKPSSGPLSTADSPIPAASALEPFTPEKKDDDDSARKDKEEKPKSLAAVKVTHSEQ